MTALEREARRIVSMVKRTLPCWIVWSPLIEMMWLDRALVGLREMENRGVRIV